MPTTPNLALPYPSPADTADVPRDIEALARALDGTNTARYTVGNLPATTWTGRLAMIELAAGCWAIGYFNGSQWMIVAGNHMTISGVPTAVAATGWRKPSPTITLTLPYAGTWQGTVYSTCTPGAAVPSIGVGIASVATAGTTAPAPSAANAHSAASGDRCNPTWTGENFAVSAGSLAWDLRVYTSVSASLNFQSARFMAQPMLLTGTA